MSVEIIDYTMFLSDKKHDYSEVAGLLKEMSELAQEKNITILTAKHMGGVLVDQHPQNPKK